MTSLPLFVLMTHSKYEDAETSLVTSLPLFVLITHSKYEGAETSLVTSLPLFVLMKHSKYEGAYTSLVTRKMKVMHTNKGVVGTPKRLIYVAFNLLG